VRKPTRTISRVFILGAVGIISLAFFRLSVSPPEPLYKGKPLSGWLDGYVLISNGRPDEDLHIAEENRKVDLIVREVGTNAIPTLFKMIELSDSPLKIKIAGFLNDHNIGTFKIKSSWPLNSQAAMAFQALGDTAADAEPRLVALLKKYRGNSYKEDLFAAALGGIGPTASNAVPSLLEVVTNRSALPYNFLNALGKIHADPSNAVPVLITFLKNSDAGTRRRAVIGLQAYGLNARSAVPDLFNLLGDESEAVRKHAADAIRAIDNDAAAKAGLN
jgi:hypothetical protein